MVESKFLKITCPRCKTEHIIFGKATLRIKCKKCNLLLIKTTGGKIKVKAKINKIL
jgi:ribosomal protein S27E